MTVLPTNAESLPNKPPQFYQLSHLNNCFTIWAGKSDEFFCQMKIDYSETRNSHFVQILINSYFW